MCVYLLVNAVNSMILNCIMGNVAWHLALLSYSGSVVHSLFMNCEVHLVQECMRFFTKGCIDHVATILNSMLTWQPFMKTICCELPYTIDSSSFSSSFCAPGS